MQSSARFTFLDPLIACRPLHVLLPTPSRFQVPNSLRSCYLGNCTSCIYKETAGRHGDGEQQDACCNLRHLYDLFGWLKDLSLIVIHLE